jgi:septum site-determining protein MinC
MRSKTTSFEIKNADLPLMALVVKTQDFSLLEEELNQRLGENPGFFSGEPAVIDLQQLPPSEGKTLDLLALCTIMKKHGLHPIAIKSTDAFWVNEADKVGLLEVSQFLPQSRPQASEIPAKVAMDPPPLQATTPPPHQPAAVTEVVREVLIPQASTLIINKPLRSGQRAYAKGGDLVVLAMVNPGAEVMADGHIHVYAPLRGRAIAGAKGDTSARIFTSCLEAELLSIAGIYRTSEVNIPKEFLGKGAQICLEGDKLVMQALG